MTPPLRVNRARADLEAALDAADDPLERARLITLYARKNLNLPPDLAALRRDCLIAASADHKVMAIARYVRLDHSRVSQLLATDPTDTPSTPQPSEEGPTS